jgi:cell division septal protein FtsQ
MKTTDTRRTLNKSAGAARRKRRTRFNRKISVATVAVLVILGCLVYYLHRPEINISEVEVSGTAVIKPALIERAVKDELAGKYFYLVPKSSYFFYPKEYILSELKSDFKRIENIEIKRRGFTGLVINVSERSERYLWCGVNFIAELVPEDECYFIDSGGYVFSGAPFYSGHLFLEFYGSLSNGDSANPVGGIVLPEDRFGKIISFKNAVAKLGLGVTKILTKNDGDYELYLLWGGRIFVNSKNDLDKNAEYLELALETDQLKKKIENERANLDYLDLRFDNKVFYKFK